MKICFYYRALRKFIGAYISALEKEYKDNLYITIVVQNSIEKQTVVDKIGDKYEIINVAEEFEKHWSNFTLEKLVYWEKKYNCFPLWYYIYIDRFLITRSREYCIKITCGYFYLYDKIFSNNNYDFYVDETIALLASYIGYIVAKCNHADYCAQMLTRGFDSEGTYFLRDVGQHNCNFDPNYLNKSYPDAIRRRAVEYYNKIQQSYIKPEYMLTSGRCPQFHLGYLFTYFKYLSRKKIPEYNNPYDYSNYEYYKTVWNGLIFYLRYLRINKYYHRPKIGDKYVLFPLHFQPEATTLVCANKYEKQIMFIDQIAKSLPADTVLYVKEHYAVLGHRSIDFYKQLKFYPNIVLIDPWENTKNLIENSQAVICLTSTVGWEAMIQRKPVIMCGEMFYDNAPGIIRVKDIYQNYMSALAQWKQPSKNDIIQYLCEHLTTMFPGCIVEVNKNFYGPDNFEKLASSFVEELKRRIRIK